MKLRSFLTFKALVCIANGLLLLLLPAMFISALGGVASPTSELMARIAGALFVGIGLMWWFARDAPDDEFLEAVLQSILVADALGFVVTLLGTLSGVLNTLGWGITALWLVMVVGLAYFRFWRPEG